MAQTPVDLLIFDLDGTLIESNWDIAHAVNFTLNELGLPERPIEEIFGFVGDGVKRLLRLAVGEGNQEKFEEALKVFRGHYLEHCLDRTTFYPGIEPMLEHFAHKQKVIATNKSIEYTRVILNGLGPQHFMYMVGGDNGFGLKPEPGMLLHIISKMGVRSWPSRNGVWEPWGPGPTLRNAATFAPCMDMRAAGCLQRSPVTGYAVVSTAPAMRYCRYRSIILTRILANEPALHRHRDRWHKDPGGTRLGREGTAARGNHSKSGKP